MLVINITQHNAIGKMAAIIFNVSTVVGFAIHSATMNNTIKIT